MGLDNPLEVLIRMSLGWIKVVQGWNSPMGD